MGLFPTEAAWEEDKSIRVMAEAKQWKHSGMEKAFKSFSEFSIKAPGEEVLFLPNNKKSTKQFFLFAFSKVLCSPVQEENRFRFESGFCNLLLKMLNCKNVVVKNVSLCRAWFSEI